MKIVYMAIAMIGLTMAQHGACIPIGFNSLDFQFSLGMLTFVVFVIAATKRES